MKTISKNLIPVFFILFLLLPWIGIRSQEVDVKKDSSGVIMKIYKDENRRVEKVTIYDSLSGQTKLSLDINESNPYKTLLKDNAKVNRSESSYEITSKDKLSTLTSQLNIPDSITDRVNVSSAALGENVQFYNNCLSVIYFIDLFDSDNHICLGYSQAKIYTNSGDLIWTSGSTKDHFRSIFLSTDNNFIGIEYGNIYGEGTDEFIPKPGVRIFDITKNKTIYNNDSPNLVGMSYENELFIINEYTDAGTLKYIFIYPEQQCMYTYTLTENEMRQSIKLTEESLEIGPSKIIVIEKNLTKIPLMP